MRSRWEACTTMIGHFVVAVSGIALSGLLYRWGPALSAWFDLPVTIALYEVFFLPVEVVVRSIRLGDVRPLYVGAAALWPGIATLAAVLEVALRARTGWQRALPWLMSLALFAVAVMLLGRPERATGLLLWAGGWSAVATAVAWGGARRRPSRHEVRPVLCLEYWPVQWLRVHLDTGTGRARFALWPCGHPVRGRAYRAGGQWYSLHVDGDGELVFRQGARTWRWSELAKLEVRRSPERSFKVEAASGGIEVRYRAPSGRFWNRVDVTYDALDEELADFFDMAERLWIDAGLRQSLLAHWRERGGSATAR